MKLGNFIDEFVAKNSLIRLWKKSDDADYSHVMLTLDPVMEWELMEIPELSKLQVKHIRSILCEDTFEAINIVVDTKYSNTEVSHLISTFRTERYSKRVNMCVSK